MRKTFYKLVLLIYPFVDFVILAITMLCRTWIDGVSQEKWGRQG